MDWVWLSWVGVSVTFFAYLWAGLSAVMSAKC